ncbi:hypothetical protein [Microbacterium sp. ZW T5_56]|uniref:hypothetical protein n=1 Tax=Microbacterium sp. ZW T5_56 TaxID=3378081 RepID=UPI0038522BE7
MTQAPTTAAITPTYHPSTPTPLSNADVEAAIAAYVAYVELAQKVDSGLASIDDLLALSTGIQHSFDRDRYESLQARGLRFEGAPIIALATLSLSTPSRSTMIAIDACIDSHDVRMFDRSGNEVAFETPPGVLSVLVTMELDPTSGAWLVSHSTPRSEGPTCE